MAKGSKKTKKSGRVKKSPKRSWKAPNAKDKRLLIVESPTKAKTLRFYLGDDFVVMASMGHVKDLPPDELGVNVEAGFEPKYEVLKGKSQVLKRLKKAAAEAREILIGSDPDREGEAIAFHIAEELRPETSAPIRRVLFYEITREEVRRAVDEPTEIDQRKVQSQQARRILDRLVGYTVSPVLWKAVRRGLSAGRVQTVALRILAEREREIKAFTPEPFWVVKAKFIKDGVEFWAEHPVKFERRQDAEALAQSLRGATFRVSAFSAKEREIYPPPPLKTSTLQQECSNRYGFSPSKTLFVAQQLYEGVDLPEGRAGLITYMRTDSVRMANKALFAIRKLLPEIFGPEYLSDKPRSYKDRGGVVQGAHECIRPTDARRTPEGLAPHLEPDQLKVYEVIWRRAMATQAAPARVLDLEAQLEAEGSQFKAKGRKVLFDGFTKILGTPLKEEPLPQLAEGEELEPAEVVVEERETKPPPRYTEASLIKTLEEKGIGRPSTYAVITSTLIQRGYVMRVKKGALVVTDLGLLVAELLVENFPDVFEEGFTARMEEALDKVEAGELTWREVLEKFWERFSPELKGFEDKAQEIKASIPEGLNLWPRTGKRRTTKGRGGKKKE